MTTQAGAQSIAVLVMAPSPVYGFERWLDAAIGCTLALLVATVAPSGPLRKPGEVAAKVVAGWLRRWTLQRCPRVERRKRC